MKSLLDIFGKREKGSNVSQRSGILKNPGDRLEARVTDSNRKVVSVLIRRTSFPPSSVHMAQL